MERSLRLATRAGMLAAAIALLAGTAPGFAGAAAAGATGGITGTVFGSGGSRLAGARVSVYAPVGHYAVCGDQRTEPAGWSVVATATTNKQGAYTVTGLSDGSYRVKVVPDKLRNDAYGYRIPGVQFDATPDGANVTPWLALAGDVPVFGGGVSRSVDVHLAQSATMAGVVTDSATGRPLSGIEVRAVRADPAGGGYQYLPDYTATTTDRQGRYTLAGLPRSAASPDDLYYGLVVVDRMGTHDPDIWWHHPFPGAASASLNANSQWSVIHDVQIAPRAPVIVHVTDGTNPVAGVQVQPTSAWPYVYLLTDAAGVVRVAGPPDEVPGTPEFWTILVSDPHGYYHSTYYSAESPTGAPTWSGATVIHPSATPLSIAMTVEPGATLTGTLWEGTPGSAAPAVNWLAGAYFDPPLTYEDEFLNAVGTTTYSACDGTFSIVVWPSSSAYTLWTRPLDASPWPPKSVAFSAPSATTVELGDIDVTAP
jgi:protocatechuate 3,4-dioxygenase beta subunit